MSLYPECDSAIEDVVNEAIVSDTNDSPVEIELSNLNASDGIKKKLEKSLDIFLNFLILIRRHMKSSVTGILMEDFIIIK